MKAARLQYAVANGIVRASIGARAWLGDPGAQLFTAQGRLNPYPVYRRIRERGPVVATSVGLVSASHPVVDQVLRDPRFGSVPPERSGAPGALDRLVAAAVMDPTTALAGVTSVPNPLGPESLIGMDPPDHTRLRRLVSRAFTPRAIARWRPRVERLADDLLDHAVQDGELDLVPGYAAPLPILAICEILGIPVEDRDRFKEWGDAVALTLDLIGPAEQARAGAALEELDAYFGRLFEQRRQDPGEEVIDTLLAAESSGEAIRPRELLATVLLLLVAGFETTVNLIGNGALLLLKHPDQLALLREDPALIPNAVEEFLRYDPPVQQDGRIAKEDLELAGVQVPRGLPVSLLLGGANRDPAVFNDPERFDVTRPDADRHLAFASGIHYCLGASLARLEGEIAFTTLLRRFGRIEAAGAPRRRRGLILRGLESLPLRVRSTSLVPVA
jgi:cytochrome P450